MNQVVSSNDDFNKYPILFEYDKSTVKSIFHNSQDSVEALNFKKGLLDLFNLNYGASEEVSEIN